MKTYALNQEQQNNNTKWNARNTYVLNQGQQYKQFVCVIYTQKYILKFIYLYVTKRLREEESFKFRVWGHDIGLRWKSLVGLLTGKKNGQRCN